MLIVPLTPSRLQKGLTVVVYSFLIIVLLTLPLWPFVLLLCCLAAYSFFLPQKFVELQLGDVVMLKTREGEMCPVTISSTSVVYPFLVVLVFRYAEGHQGRVLIWQDSTDQEIFRQLRVRLCWGV